MMKWEMVRFWGGILILVGAILIDSASAQIRHEVFLPNTEHELNVYRIFGEEPGNTIMIIGGIQGDEPGSYLTADLYADINLKKGNLIVVPRANFYSILLNQRNGLTGDMNRKFDAVNNKKNNLEEEIVAILKHLIAESECLLNLHEGSGFYSPSWISKLENPKRYGQSIIYDTELFSVPGKDRTVNLGVLARKVIDKVNCQISEKRHHFRANNHDTLSEKSLHKEQRKSATFYALTRAHIPAFGVEISKMINGLETRIRLSKLAVNTFMAEFGIILDSPGVNIEQPKLNYLLMKVNDDHAFAMPHGSELEIAPGDNVVVTDIIANYERGLVADIQGLGNRNDTRIPFRIYTPTKVIVYKDSRPCGWVDLKLKSTVSSRKTEKVCLEELRAEQLMVDIEGEMKTVAQGQTLKIKKGSRLILQGVRTNIVGLDDQVLLNFKGFAPPKAVNDGNDLQFPIYTGQDLWARYSENRQGKRYPVEATYKDKLIGKFWIELEEI